MANGKEIVYIGGAAVVVLVMVIIYKKMIAAKDAVAQAYTAAVDKTADVIADVSGLTDKEAELAKPINKDSAGFLALTKVVKAYTSGGQVEEKVWQEAYKEYPDYGTVLRAGKLWGYGYLWNYIGKDY